MVKAKFLALGISLSFIVALLVLYKAYQQEEENYTYFFSTSYILETVPPSCELFICAVWAFWLWKKRARDWFLISLLAFSAVQSVQIATLQFFFISVGQQAQLLIIGLQVALFCVFSIILGYQIVQNLRKNQQQSRS